MAPCPFTEDRRPCWLLSALLILGWATAVAGPVRLANGHLGVALDPQTGALVELVDLEAGHDHIAPSPAPVGVWEIDVGDGTAVRTLSPAQARICRAEPAGRGTLPADRGATLLREGDGHGARTRGSGFRVVWEGFDVSAAPDLRVEVEARLEASAAMSRWNIRVERNGNLALRAVRFPRVAWLAAQTNELLAVPVWLGQQTAQARQLLSGTNGDGRRLSWTYPGQLSLQCLAFCAPPRTGLYVASDDTAAFSKTFTCFGDGQGNIGCELVHLPERRGAGAGNWRLPYEVVLGTFRGDWFAAAERYRAWGTNQAWARQSRLARGLVPGWAAETGLWVWNRGRSDGVLAPALALRRESGLAVNVFWHWWHGCAYDAGFPEYLPPREGTEAFKAALADAHTEGLRTLVYMNQRLWGMNTQSWRDEGAQRFAVKGADGKLQPEIYNTFTKTPCAAMCLGTEFWRDKYAGLAARAAGELEVDGIYMDQACASLACYDTGHGHPPGGGSYWLTGFRSLAEDIRRRCAAPPVTLAGEGCGEPWLPHLDLMLSLQVSRERYAGADAWETIPFFQAVYHPYAVTFGNYSSLTMPPYDDLWPAEFAPKEPLRLLDRKFSRQFLLEQARAFVWGQQPTIANFRPDQLAQRADEIDYVVRLAKIRSRAAKYLLHGTFLPPPDLHAPEATVDISRLSIYAGQQGGLKEFQKRVPLAVAGAWRAPDGDVALALASIADEPLTLPINPDGVRYGLRKGAFYRTDENGSRRVSDAMPGTVRLEVSLPPRGGCLWEFRAGTGARYK